MAFHFGDPRWPGAAKVIEAVPEVGPVPMLHLAVRGCSSPSARFRGGWRLVRERPVGRRQHPDREPAAREQPTDRGEGHRRPEPAALPLGVVGSGARAAHQHLGEGSVL